MLKLKAAPAAQAALDPIDVLREMNMTGSRKVPDDAPVSFARRAGSRSLSPMKGWIVTFTKSACCRSRRIRCDPAQSRKVDERKYRPLRDFKDR
ncbi:hypothetical protein [Janthinobacterium sp. CAN_S1]|uniref:hypothetical protein n=1 Tax=Janthinobacterium sp. CG_23.4 TaxID=2760707 RepID=UPI0018CB3685|nr:hypothetical protein [Janthinobacterium sp. CG_23.4]